MSRRLLLVSNSTAFGEGYLDHCVDEMLDFLGDVRRLLFVPFAVFDRESYGLKAVVRFAEVGVEVDVLTADEVGRVQLGDAPAVFVGGGNTFRLLKTLQDSDLLANTPAVSLPCSSTEMNTGCGFSPGRCTRVGPGSSASSRVGSHCKNPPGNSDKVVNMVLLGPPSRSTRIPGERTRFHAPGRRYWFRFF